MSINQVQIDYLTKIINNRMRHLKRLRIVIRLLQADRQAHEYRISSARREIRRLRDLKPFSKRVIERASAKGNEHEYRRNTRKPDGYTKEYYKRKREEK